MISKKIREIVYKKYNGHCAYCGCKIEYKDMQIDHIVPKYRNNEKWHQGEIGTDDMEISILLAGRATIISGCHRLNNSVKI